MKPRTMTREPPAQSLRRVPLTPTAAPTTASPTTAAPATADPAGAVRCDTNRDVLEIAVRAHELTTGAPPANQQELVAAGLLEGPVTTHELRPGPDGVEIVGVGGCADR